MKRYFFTPIFIIVFAFSSIGQDSTITRDFESWVSVGFYKNLADKKLRFSLQQQVRSDDNSSRTSQYITEAKLGYKLAKKTKIGGAYRFIRDRKGKDGFMTEHRLSAFSSYKQDINRLDIQYRIMWQYRTNGEYDTYGATKYRFRTKFDYNIKKWKYDPYLSAEIFYSKEDMLTSYTEGYIEAKPISGFQKVRLKTGTDFKVKKVGTFNIFYMLEHQFKEYESNYFIPVTWHIIGINYEFKL